MYSDAAKRSRSRMIWPIAALVIAALIFFAVGKKPGRDIREESAAAIRDAVQRAALQCYAVEGIYPPDLEYLEDNYGLKINTKDFYVTYDAFASNLPPTVIVQSK